MAEKKNFNGKKNNNRKNTKPTVRKREYIINIPEFCGETIEYKMGKAMAEDILRDNKSKKPAQELLCEHVNEDFGLKGYCVRVIIDAN